MAVDKASRGRERRKHLKDIQAKVRDEKGQTSSTSERGRQQHRPEGVDLDAFVGKLKERKRQKKHQLQVIQEFVENPVKFGVQTDFIPTSTTLEEIRSRKKDVQYRIDQLKNILQALEGEMRILCQAEQGNREENDPAS